MAIGFVVGGECYSVGSGDFLELVKEKAHKAALPHSGACAQYDAVNGSSYNTRRR